MNEQTEKTIQAVSAEGAKYDESAGELFLNKEIVAPILQMVIPEYEGCTIEEIIRCIDSDISRDDPLDDIDVRILADRTEVKSVTEKLIRYDMHFMARNPRLSNEHIIVRLHIDLEVQNNYRPSDPAYPVIKRGIYYCARELSAQLGRLTATTNYNDLEKVYSVWICNENIPERERNTISAYRIMKKDILGSVEEDEAAYDLMTAIIIRRGNDINESGILDYLEGVFSSDIEKMKRYSDVSWSEKAEREGHRMEGLGEAIYRRGSAEGRVEGRIEGQIAGKTEGLSDALLTVLSSKGEVSEKLEKKIQSQTRNELLEQWLKIAALAPDVNAFEEQIMCEI